MEDVMKGFRGTVRVVMLALGCAAIVGVVGYSSDALAVSCPSGSRCITVTSTALDLGGNAEPGCSLDEAVAAVQNGATYFGCTNNNNADTILVPTGQYDEEEGLYPGNVTIIGDGVGKTVLYITAFITPTVVISYGTLTMKQLTIQGMSLQQPAIGLYVDGGSNVTLDHVRVTGFNNGGIQSSGLLTLSFSTVDGNVTAGAGGGVFMDSGEVDVLNSAITSNSAQSGGGIAVVGGGTLVVNYSTIAKNKATAGNGGGIECSGQVVKGLHDTVAFNSATGVGGGVHATGSIKWDASIFAFNTGASGKKDDYSGTVRSDPNECLQDGLNKNLITTLSNPAPGGWNLVNTNLSPDGKIRCTSSSGIGDFVSDPLFSTGLAGNGGPTNTYALKPNGSDGKGGSRAINAGVKPSNPNLWFDHNFTMDQRGKTAPLGGLYDLGSFEAQ
jgi:hypothetical protein